MAKRPQPPSKALVPVTDKSADVRAFDVPAEAFERLGEIARVDLEGTDEALAALGADELGRAKMSVIRAGAYFLKLKQQCAHGDFNAVLARVGVEPRGAQEAMQTTRFVLSLPKEQALRIGVMPKSRILQLVNAEPEVVAELIESGSLDGDQPLSVRELRKRIAALEAEKARLETQNAVQKREAQRRYALRDESGLPPPVREARDETMVEAAALGVALDGLQRIAEDFLLAKDVDAASLPLRPVLATTYVHALGSQLARASELFARVRKAFAKQVGDALHDDHLLDAESIARYRGAFEQLLAGNQVAREQRDNDRANTQSGRKGRKRGS